MCTHSHTHTFTDTHTDGGVCTCSHLKKRVQIFLFDKEEICAGYTKLPNKCATVSVCVCVCVCEKAVICVYSYIHTYIDISARSFAGNFVCLFAFENNFYDVPSVASSSSSHAFFCKSKNWETGKLEECLGKLDGNR